MKLSVIVTNYNHGKYLEQCLDAIIDQSYQSKEIIVIDDASTDNSRKIIERYSKNKKIQIAIFNPTNIGHLKSIQKVITVCSGKYIHFAAADDVIRPGLYEKSIKMLEDNPAAAYCSALMESIDEKGANLGLFPSPLISMEPIFLQAQMAMNTVFNIGPWWTSQTAIFRKDAAIKEGIFIPELKNYADSFLCHILALKYGCCFIPEVLGTWRRLKTGYAQTENRKTISQLKVVSHAKKILKQYIPLVISQKYADGWIKQWRWAVLSRVGRKK